MLIFLKGGTAWAAAVPVTFSGGKAYVGAGTDGEGIALSSAYPDSYEGATFTFKFFDEVPTENSAYFGAEYRNLLVNLDVDPAESYSLYNTYPERTACTTPTRRSAKQYAPCWKISARR